MYRQRILSSMSFDSGKCSIIVNGFTFQCDRCVLDGKTCETVPPERFYWTGSISLRASYYSCFALLDHTVGVVQHEYSVTITKTAEIVGYIKV